MNRIHNKIWSRALNQLVVVSELAACRGSGVKRTRRVRDRTPRRRLDLNICAATAPLGRKSVMALLLVLAGVTAPKMALAQYAAGGGTTSGSGQVAISGNCGGTADAKTQGGSANYNAVAIGCYATTDGVNATAIGPNAQALANGTVALGVNSTANAANATALGVGSSASGAGATAVGVGANASGAIATAIGDGAQAGVGATALGSSVTSNGNGAVAAGTGAQALTDHSTALGWQSYATGLNSVYLGARTVGTGASAESAIAIGTDVSSSGTYAIGMGLQANASQSRAIAIGSRTGASGLASIAIGGDATAGANASGDNSISIGSESSASGNRSAAMGFLAQASDTQALALGDGAVASASQSVALGSGAASSGTSGSIAVGANSTASGTTSVSVGVSSTATGATSAAFGPAANAAADRASAFGPSAAANAASTVAFGDTATVAATAGAGSIAGGHNSQVLGGIGAVALGEGNAANGDGAVAIGDPNTATGDGAIAQGKDNTATGNGSVAMGNTNMVGGGGQAVGTPGTAAQGAVGIGYQNTVVGQGSVAIGNTSSALAAGAVAFGDTAVANHAGDVALGSGSATDTAVGTTSASINGTTYTFAGTTPGSTVSVGASGAERTVTNLAAGRIGQNSTDAINGSQLYATNQAVTAVGTTVTNLGNTIATGIGGGTSYDPGTGNLTTNVSYGGNTYSSLQQVFDQIDGSVGGGGIKYFHANSTLADSSAAGTDSVAIGPVSNATTADAVSIGNGATAGANTGDVALGAGSTTDTAVGTPNTVINGATYTFAGTAPTSTVSMGAPGTERTVTNVAAGRLGASSTDAINGSQLFRTNQAVDIVGTTVTNLGDSIANSYGGSTTYDPGTGTLNTSITYGGNTYSSLQQIFNQIDSVVGGGGIKYFHANSTLADSQATGTDSVAIGPVSTASTTDAVSIGNGATAGTNAGDVALGAGSVTGAVVQTGGGTIDGNAYTYAGATPSSTVSVGRAGNERTITNVAAGQVNGSSTDAINGSQLFATNQAVENLSSAVTASAIHYYSVNDGGTTGGNYANDGATGLDALAAGVGASAAADRGTALGENTQSTVLGGVALGSAAVSDRAIAPTSGSILVGTNVIPYNTTDRTLLGAVSVGNTTDFRQITNLADGTQDQDAVTLRQLKGAMSSFSVTPIEYFHANSTASDSAAIGAESVAIGPQTTVNGDNGIGLGNGAIVQQTAPGGTAIGQNATVNLADGVALGTNATSNGIQAMALGAGAEAAYAGSVALGAGSSTDAAVGTASTVLAGTTHVFAGATPGSTVSVGSAGAERTITNVAAGRISATSTDAINGSQLFATNQTLQALYDSLSDLSDTVDHLPAGNSTSNTYQTSTDDTSSASATGSDSTAAGAGSSASGDNSTAIGAGSTASGDNSVAVGAGSVATEANSVSVGSAGNERTVTNVAPGVNATDAVNVSQLDQAIESAKDWSRNYVDQRFRNVDRDLDRIGNRANAGVASAMAMASLPQAYQPNQNSAGVALGSFHGETGIAVGVSAISESGRYVLKLNATTNSRGDTGAGIGAGVVW